VLAKFLRARAKIADIFGKNFSLVEKVSLPAPYFRLC